MPLAIDNIFQWSVLYQTLAYMVITVIGALFLITVGRISWVFSKWVRNKITVPKIDEWASNWLVITSRWIKATRVSIMSDGLRFTVIAISLILSGTALYLFSYFGNASVLPTHPIARMISISIVAIFTGWQCFVVYQSYAVIKIHVKKSVTVFVTASISLILGLTMLAVYINPDNLFGNGNSTNSVGNVLTFLAVILTFVGVVNYLLYELNKRDIERKIEDISQDMQNYAAASSHNTTAYSLWVYYQSFCESQRGHQNPVCNGTAHEDLLRHAIDEARVAVEFANKLNGDKDEEMICACKNNLAFFSAISDKPEDTVTAFDEGKYIFGVANDGTVSAKYSNAWGWKATWALVLMRRSSNEPQLNTKIAEIISSIKTDHTVSHDQRIELQKCWRFIAEKTSCGIIAAAAELLCNYD